MSSIVSHLGENLPWTAFKNGHNNYTITFTSSGSAYNISTYVFVVNIRNPGHTTNELQLTEGSGITNGGASGVLTIDLTQTQASTTLPGDQYFYQIAYTKDSKVYALFQGGLTLAAWDNPGSTTTSVSASVSLAGSAVSAAVTLAGGSVTAASIATALGAQTATHFYGGPTPSFRAIADADIPAAIARLASPTFTGVPAAPTAAVATDTTQLATTAFVTGVGTFSGAKTFSASPTAPQNTTSERFGASANAATYTECALFGQNTLSAFRASTIFGYGAYSITSDYDFQASSFGGAPTIFGTQANGNGTSIGYQAVTGNREAIAIGPKSQATALATLAIGDGAKAIPTGVNGNQIVIGDAMYAKGNVNWVIGGGFGAEHDYVFAVGAGGNTGYNLDCSTADHQGFLGWYQHDHASFSAGQGLFNDWYLGGPVQASAPANITLSTPSGLGTNVAGATLDIRAGRGTGSGGTGILRFWVSTAIGSGSSLQTWTSRLQIDSASVTVTGGDKLVVGATTNTLGMNVSNYGNSSTTGIGVVGYNMYITTAGAIGRDNTSTNAMSLAFNNAFSENRIHSMFTTSGGTTTSPQTMESTGNFQAISGGQFGWVASTTSARDVLDTGFARVAAADVRVTNGTTGNGSIRGIALVSAKTSNYTVVAADVGKFFDNTGAGGAVNFTLPTAAVGLQYTFYIDAAQTLTVTAAASTTIRIAGSVSAAAGNITANTVGNSVTLVAISTTQWVATQHEGTWTVN